MYQYDPLAGIVHHRFAEAYRRVLAEAKAQLSPKLQLLIPATHGHPPILRLFQASLSAAEMQG